MFLILCVAPIENFHDDHGCYNPPLKSCCPPRLPDPSASPGPLPLHPFLTPGAVGMHSLALGEEEEEDVAQGKAPWRDDKQDAVISCHGRSHQRSGDFKGETFMLWRCHGERWSAGDRQL